MPLFSVFFIVLSYLQIRGLETTVQNLSLPSQNFCTNLLDFSSNHLHLYKAIACGASIKKSSYEILKIVSLWHLIIVSAGHFKVILWALNKIKSQFSIIPHAGLLIFCFATGAQPPVVRAFVDFELRIFSRKWKLFIPSEYCTLYSSCLILLCFPSWTHSWSFLLSWLCGILILLLQKHSLFIQALGISIGVFPISILFSTPHPFGFLFNIFFGPPLSLILFPLCILMIPFPFLHHLTDPFVDNLLIILTKFAGNPESFNNYSNIISHNAFWGAWIYVLCLQAYALYKKSI